MPGCAPVLGVHELRGEEAVETRVELWVLQVVLHHEDEEPVEGEGGDDAALVVGSGEERCQLQRRGEVGQHSVRERQQGPLVGVRGVGQAEKGHPRSVEGAPVPADVPHAALPPRLSALPRRADRVVAHRPAGAAVVEEGALGARRRGGQEEECQAGRTGQTGQTRAGAFAHLRIVVVFPCPQTRSARARAAGEVAHPLSLRLLLTVPVWAANDRPFLGGTRVTLLLLLLLSLLPLHGVRQRRGARPLPLSAALARLCAASRLAQKGWDTGSVAAGRRGGEAVLQIALGSWARHLRRGGTVRMSNGGQCGVGRPASVGGTNGGEELEPVSGNRVLSRCAKERGRGSDRSVALCVAVVVAAAPPHRRAGSTPLNGGGFNGAKLAAAHKQGGQRGETAQRTASARTR